MFILHIDTGAHMRGGQWQVFYLLGELTAKGHNVRLLAPKGSELLRNAIAAQYDALPLGIPTLLGAVSGVDLIHAHDAHAHTLALLGRKPVIVSRRVGFPVRQSRASRWKYRSADHFIAVSEYVKRTLIDARQDPAKISVVYDGVPIPAAPKTGSRSRVVALDSNDPGKGKSTIEHAAKLANIPIHFSNNLSQDLADAALFVYITELEGLGSAALLAMANHAAVIASNVGGLPEIVEDGVTGLLTSNDPGKGKNIVEQTAKLANIPIHFSSNLPQDLADAALFVYITELEGLGSAALLAMANHAAVIASNVGGLPEIVEDGVTGLLTSNDPKTIATLIERLLNDPPFTARLAAAARARVEQKFSIGEMANQTVRVYERILN